MRINFNDTLNITRIQAEEVFHTAADALLLEDIDAGNCWQAHPVVRRAVARALAAQGIVQTPRRWAATVTALTDALLVEIQHAHAIEEAQMGVRA